MSPLNQTPHQAPMSLWLARDVDRNIDGSCSQVFVGRVAFRAISSRVGRHCSALPIAILLATPAIPKSVNLQVVMVGRIHLALLWPSPQSFQKSLSKEYASNHMGGCQNYGPFLLPQYNTAPRI